MTQDSDLSLAESAALADQQRRDVEHAMRPDERALFLAWGLAWLVGLGLFALTSGLDPVWDVSEAVAGITLGALVLVAGVVTVITIRRATAGLSGPGQLAGTLYGWSWPLAFLALGCLISGAENVGVSDDAISLMWTAGPGLVVGMMYLAGGAVWLDRRQYALGVWLLLSTSVGCLLGLTSLYAVMALAGGGGFLVTAALAGGQRG